MLSDTVLLPVPGSYFWFGDTTRQFSVCIEKPNGFDDQNTDNDCYTTKYEIPDMYNNTIILRLKTNQQPWRYSLTVTDVFDNVLFTRSNMDINTIYNDTLDLGNGCYTITLLDQEDMGLTYWAYPEQGAGWFSIYTLGDTLLKSFKSDFGRSIRYSFTKGDLTYIKEPNVEKILMVYPNPADDQIRVVCDNWSGKVMIRLYDMLGNIVYQSEENYIAGIRLQIPVSDLKNGLYMLIVSDHEQTARQKVIIH